MISKSMNDYEESSYGLESPRINEYLQNRYECQVNTPEYQLKNMSKSTKSEKIKIYDANEWKKIIENNDIENTSTSEIFNSLKYGIPDVL